MLDDFDLFKLFFKTFYSDLYLSGFYFSNASDKKVKNIFRRAERRHIMPEPPKFIKIEREPPLIDNSHPQADLIARFFSKALCTTSSEKRRPEEDNDSRSAEE
jgi:hypothetical protein